MFRRDRRKERFRFALLDVCLIALAFETAYESRVLLPFERLFYLVPPTHGLLLGFSALVWPLAGVWLRAYDRAASGHAATLVKDTFRQTATGIIFLVAFQYLIQLPFPLSRSFLVLFLAYSWAALSVGRLSVRTVVRIARRESESVQRVFVVGTGPSAQRLAEALERSARHGILLVGFLGGAPGKLRLKSEYPVHDFRQLQTLLRRHVVDEIIFTVDDQNLSAFNDIFVVCDQEGVRTRIVMDFFPHVNSEMYLDWLDTLPLLTFSAAPHDEVRLLVKRLIDFVAAAAAIIVLFPAMLTVGLLIRLTSPGGAIFRQVRCGLNGRRFTLYKFRSMCENAEELKAKFEHLNMKATAFKIRNDPRLTPLGRWLRRFSIDEWPQFWNVLRGEMSLVGPRPATPDEVDRYAAWQRRRLRMRPGLTCLWALKGRDYLDFETWMKLDMTYIDQWSLALDWKILLLTVPRVLTGRDAN